MDFKVRIWNYRNVHEDKPVEIEIKRGITFLLGINNIGKSNLLKFFYEFRNIVTREFHNGFTQSVELGTTYDQIVNRRNLASGIKFEIEFDNQISYFQISPTDSNYHTSNITLSIRYSHPNNSANRAVIHQILRNIFYIGSFRSTINNSSGSHYDISVGQNFINEWIQWSDGRDVTKQQRIKSLKNELKNLFSYQDFNIRINADRNNLLITADGEDFFLTDMGSGISHFIIVLANVMIRQPSIILIDEPETNLHPRLQETFTRILASKASEGLIATSHSIGLARSVADNIYSIAKDDKDRTQVMTFGSHFKPTISQSIHEMGYAQFVEIGGNNILLVEGRTDIKFFREILRKYAIENKFIILSFGGSQFIAKDKTKIIDELAEVKRLNAKSVSVIFDSERALAEAKLTGEFKTFYDTCVELGFNVFATDRHSTENYLTQAATSKVLGREFRPILPFEKFDKTWDKNKNWLIANEMTKEDLKGTGLAEFIEKILAPLAKEK